MGPSPEMSPFLFLVRETVPVRWGSKGGPQRWGFSDMALASLPTMAVAMYARNTQTRSHM